MRNPSKLYRSLSRVCLVLLPAAAALSMAACATTSTTSSEAPQLMLGFFA